MAGETMNANIKNRLLLIIIISLACIPAPAHAEGWFSTWIFNPIKQHSTKIAAVVGVAALAAIGYCWYKKSNKPNPPAKKKTLPHHQDQPKVNPLQTINDAHQKQLDTLEQEVTKLYNEINRYLTDEAVFSQACDNQTLGESLFLFQERISALDEEAQLLLPVQLNDSLTGKRNLICTTLKELDTLVDTLSGRQQEWDAQQADRLPVNSQAQNALVNGPQQQHIVVQQDQTIIPAVVIAQGNKPADKESEEKKLNEEREEHARNQFKKNIQRMHGLQSRMVQKRPAKKIPNKGI